MGSHRRDSEHEPAPGVGLAVAVGFVAVLVCWLALGTRTLTSVDLGYHLAYGEHALVTGRLVDHNPYLYTLPSEDLAASERPSPGPGSWYDERGRYRFPNANWLSQVAMAAVHRSSGESGLSVLASALVFSVGFVTLWTLRRLGISWNASLASLLWLGLVCYSRFNLRPELFGYLVLASEMALLGPLVAEPRRFARISWRSWVAVAALHGLFINLHSYSTLGVIVVGAVFGECCIRGFIERADAPDGWRRARWRSGMLLVSMLVLSFANPWTWRLALLPFQTLLYLREYDIGGVPGSHPWSYILEFRQTLHAAFPNRLSDFGIAGLLALGGAGSVAALLRRRWALLIVLAVMSAVALSMRRNVAPAALVLIPLGSAALLPYFETLTAKFTRRLSHRDAVTIVGASFVTLVAVVFAHAIATNRFYLAEGHPMRFGVGISRANLPVGAAHWLDTHLPGARVWTDMGNSSSLHFFTQPHRDVPILTNTWAYPPAVMAEQREVRGLQRSLKQLVDNYGAEAVLVGYESSPPLFRALAANPDWDVVHVEGRNVLFARIDPGRPVFVRDLALAALDDIDAYVARQRQTDPALELALLHPGIVYLHAGLGDLAVATFSAIVRERPEWTEAWNYLGLGYIGRVGQARSQARADVDIEGDIEQARRAFNRARELDPENEIALRNLTKLSRHRARPQRR